MSHYSIDFLSNLTMSKENDTDWVVYLLRCIDNSLYCGVTTDISRRIWQHNHCNKTGAKYTRVRRPVSLVYQETQPCRKTACQREYQIKQLNKKQKEQLIQQAPN